MAPNPFSRRFGASTAIGAVLAGALVATAGAAPAQAADSAIITPSQLDTSPTRATGHVDFRADGVRVRTEGNTSTDKAAGYFDVDTPLADTGSPALRWSGSANRPGLQLTTDFDGDGDVDGVLVGEPVYGDNFWVGSVDDAAVFAGENTPRVGGGGSDLNGTLAQWRTAFPNARVLQAGFSLGSGVQGDGIVDSIVVGGTTYYFSNDESTSTRELFSSDVDQRETRATGHNEFRPTSGVRVYTEGATSTDKAAGYFAVNTPLSRAGEPALQWRSNGTNTVRPGLQLVLDIDGDAQPDGILVGERVYADGTKLYQEPNGLTNWWATNGSKAALKALAPSNSGGYGSENNGTLAEWRRALPAGTTVLAAGWSLGSGVKGDGVIEAITVGTTTYTFTGRNQAPEAAPVAATVVAGVRTVVVLGGTDPEGGPLTYRVNGAIVPNGRYLYVSRAGFVGTDTLTYTVTDAEDVSRTGTIKVDVVPAATAAALTVGPAAPTSRSIIGLRLRVASTGVTQGGVVGVAVDGRGAATGRVSNGLARIKLSRPLAKGTHTILVRYRGTATTNPVTITRRITVR
ncbi:Ig-like domain-containing protein [Aeromicrobium sp.]|uniref:Ig-like domain-containing protein n=1 Tax=Aeromicrobium sp. TaxID=1871063 RepID=UPI003516BD64